MPEFEADLKRAFAALEDPADNGFSHAVAHRVAGKEWLRTVQTWAHLGAFVVAGGAFAYGIISAVQAIGPGLMADFGLGVAEAHGALAAGSIPAGLGALATPFLIAVATGIGGLAVVRAVRP